LDGNLDSAVTEPWPDSGKQIKSAQCLRALAAPSLFARLGVILYIRLDAAEALTRCKIPRR
jgi:hypothetical protein